MNAVRTATAKRKPELVCAFRELVLPCGYRHHDDEFGNLRDRGADNRNTAHEQRNRK